MSSSRRKGFVDAASFQIRHRGVPLRLPALKPAATISPMPDRTALKVGDRIRLLRVPQVDLDQREWELRDGAEDAGITADTIERIIRTNPVVTIARRHFTVSVGPHTPTSPPHGAGSGGVGHSP